MSDLADETGGDLPVKDVGLTLPKIGKLPGSSTARSVKAGRDVSQLSRKELEDKFISLHDESILLKQEKNKQEETIKRMGTRIMRLVNDKKKSELAGGSPKRLGRVVELEGTVEQLQERVCGLEKQNKSLRNKLISRSQQLCIQGNRPRPYKSVSFSVDTGVKIANGDAIVPKPPKKGMKLRSLEVRSPHVQSRFGQSLLGNARTEIRNLETVVDAQKERIEQLEHIKEVLENQLRKKEQEIEEYFQHMKEQEIAKRRLTIQGNIEMIKVRKELAEKSNAFSVVEGKLLQLQENQEDLKASYDVLTAKNDELSLQLKEERMKCLRLENELQLVTVSNRRTEELQEKINLLEQEKELLKENYDKLSDSVLSMTHERQWKLKEEQLKLRIVELEAAIKSLSAEKDEILKKIKEERDRNKTLMQENSYLQVRNLENMHQLDDLKNRFVYLSKECNVDVAELNDTLLLIKVQRQRKNEKLLHLEKEDDDMNKDLKASMQKLQLAHADTVRELEKTRDLLTTQHKISKGYQTEVEAVKQKMESLRKEYELKLGKRARLLGIRTARLRKLEAQLRDNVFGTKQYKSRQEIPPGNPVNGFHKTQCLERGENVFEIHIRKVTFSSAAMHTFSDHEPAIFCTYTFYDFELQATPILHGCTLSYDFTSLYVVRVNDSFWNYIQTNTVTLEVHQAYGAGYETVAACQLGPCEILENKGRIYRASVLTGKRGNIPNFGTVVYWIGLQVPLDLSTSLYQEKCKALGYITPKFSKHKSPFQQPILRTVQVSTSADANLNELHVTIKCCNGLQSRKKYLQPNPYVVYKVFDFADHDSPVIHSSSNPQIDDRMCFCMPMTADLDRYLKSESLRFCVFDAAAMEEDCYLGVANVPLISLAHDKPISGTFELTDFERRATGTIEVELKWKFPYLPPSGATVAADLGNYIENEKSVAPKLLSEQEMQPPALSPFTSSVTVPILKQRHRAPKTDKRVLFLDASSIPMTDAVESDMELKSKVKTSTDPNALEVKQERLADVKVKEIAQEIQQEKDLSYLSEELLSYGSSVTSGDKAEGTEELEPEAAQDDKYTNDSIESVTTDSDDCIVTSSISKTITQATEKIRFEVISLALTESRIVQDETIKQLFVECRLSNFTVDETPVSLPKPTKGHRVHFNYSSVIHVDKANYRPRREYLKLVLEEADLKSDSLQFTVISDPPEEEQHLDCEDIGFAYVSLREIFQRGRDVIERDIAVYDSQDHKAVIGKLKVTVEALQALHSICREWDDDQEA